MLCMGCSKSCVISNTVIAEHLVPALLGQAYRVRMRVTGESMHPTVSSGELVVIEPMPAESLRIGDVILYRRPAGALVLHRLLARTREGDFICGGDATARLDEPVSRGAVLGRQVLQGAGPGRLGANRRLSRFAATATSKARAVRQWLRVGMHYAVARIVRRGVRAKLRG